MIGAVVIFIIALITAILCGIVAWKNRYKYVRIEWTAFVAMGLGAFAVGLFYLSIAIYINNNFDLLVLIPYSRLLWFFVLLSTSTMAFIALKNKSESDE